MTSSNTGYQVVQPIPFLRLHLGDGFVNWVLADPGDEPSAQQAEVSLTIARMLRQRMSAQPELPIGLVARSLVFYRPEWGRRPSTTSGS